MALILYKKFINGQLSIFDDSLFQFRTFHCFEANSHVKYMSWFVICSAFVTFFRFDLMINHDGN